MDNSDPVVTVSRVAAKDTPPQTQPQTQHGLLVAWGHFVRTTGLLDKMLTVPIMQRVRGARDGPSKGH